MARVQPVRDRLLSKRGTAWSVPNAEIETTENAESARCSGLLTGTAVIDPNRHGTPISKVCHAQPGVKWQTGVTAVSALGSNFSPLAVSGPSE